MALAPSESLKRLRAYVDGRELALTVAKPMAYGRPLTQAEKESKPACACDLRSSDDLVLGAVAPEQRPRLRALLATLYVGCDMLDEAHDLVTPDSSAGSDAAYVHALLHRREGPHDGELGLTGFQNARYWNRVLGRHPLFDDLPNLAEDVLRDYPDPRAAAFVKDGLRRWDPDAFVALAERATDGTLLAYCTAFQRREWALLFDWTAKAVFGGGGAAS